MLESDLLKKVNEEGRMILILLAILGASLSAGAREAEIVPEQKPIKFEITAPMPLPSLAVYLSNPYSGNPTYTVVLPNGQSVDLPPSVRKPNIGKLTPQQIAEAAEDTRTIVEATARLLHSRKSFVAAEISGDTVSGIAIDPKSLVETGLNEFDPLRALYDDMVLKAPETDFVMRMGQETWYALQSTKNGLAFVARSARSRTGRAELKAKATERFIAVLAAIKEAVWESTIRARWTHEIQKVRNQKLDLNTTEVGVQITLRAEFQFGVGKFAVMKTLPFSISIGYNKVTRRISYRRGIRTEKMDGGSAFSFSFKGEIKKYRLTADVVDNADPRPGYGSFKGETWMAPSPPAISYVAEVGRGFHSAGLSIGFNAADYLFPGTFLLNTVNLFEETHKVAYSAPLPDPEVWMRKLHAQVKESAAVFESKMVRGGRCELLFKPSPSAR